jgi:hypothetical protein
VPPYYTAPSGEATLRRLPAGRIIPKSKSGRCTIHTFDRVSLFRRHSEPLRRLLAAGQEGFVSNKHATVKQRLYLAGFAILLAGILSAAWVYLNATDEDSDNNVVSVQIVAGHRYVLTKDDSKRYHYDMEHLAGKYGVVADEVQQWLSGLWHGKQLAYALLLLSIIAALGCFLVAQHPDYQNGKEDG